MICRFCFCNVSFGCQFLEIAFAFRRFVLFLFAESAKRSHLRVRFFDSKRYTLMLTIKAGEIAGRIWTALDEKGTLTGKELKKVCGRLTDKELYLGLGWLLREEKIETAEVEKDITARLK